MGPLDALSDKELLDRAKHVFGKQYRVAEFFGVSPQAISEWRTEGIPENARVLLIQEIRRREEGEGASAALADPVLAAIGESRATILSTTLENRAILTAILREIQGLRADGAETRLSRQRTRGKKKKDKEPAPGRQARAGR